MDQFKLRPVVYFVLLSFGLAWLVALPLWLDGGLKNRLFIGVAIVIMWVPALSAFVVTRMTEPHAQVRASLGLAPWRPLRRTFWFCLSAVLASLAMSLIALVIGAVFGVYHFDLQNFSGLGNVVAAKYGSSDIAMAKLPPLGMLAFLAVATVIPGALFNTVATLGEEIGWRGWLLPRLMPLGSIPALVISGLIWGVWHAPLILLGYDYPATSGWLALVCMSAMCIVLGSVLGWFRLRSGSVWPAAIGHGAVNAAAGLPLVLGAVGQTIDPTQATLLGWTGWIFPALLALTLFRFSPMPDGAPTKL